MDKQPIDPLLKIQYDDQLAEEAAKKAKALMEQPEQHLAIPPEHNLVESKPQKLFWQQGPGKINQFVGEGDNAIYREQEIDELKKLEDRTLNEADKSRDKLLEMIPEGKEALPLDEWKFKRDMHGETTTDVPYNQDEDDSAAA